MTLLERQQRGVLALMKQRPDVSGDSWLEALANSPDLALVREIAVWWRRFQIESQCLYTSRLLKRKGCFESQVGTYFQLHATSSFIERLAPAFLYWLSEHSDPLVRCVAQFEWAGLQLRDGRPIRSRIVWDRNPVQLLAALGDLSPLPAVDPRYSYVMDVAAAIPGRVACFRQLRERAA